MIKALIFTIFLVSFSSYSKNCKMKVPKIIIRDASLKEADLKIQGDCKDSTTSKLKNFICNNTGAFNKSQLSRYLNLPQDLFELEGETQVFSLNDFVNESYHSAKNKSFMGTSFIGPQKYMTASSMHDLKVSCPQCEESIGEKNIKLIRNNESGNNQDVWLKTTIAFEVEAFFPTKVIHPSIEKLNQSEFVRRKTKTAHPGRLISDVERLKFLQLRRILDPNKPIKQNDFIPQNLVSAGKPARVVFKSRGINLSLKALPLNYGKYGDIIKLRNPRSKQIIMGTVIDFNTVLVEL